MPAGSALLAGERHGVPIEGFDLGNSPGECTPERLPGQDDGHHHDQRHPGAAGLPRRRAGASWARSSTSPRPRQRLLHEARPIHLVCAGTEGRISYEDTLLAGAFAKHFKDLDHPMGNDEAEIAAGLWARVEDAIWFKSGGKKVRAEEPNPLVRYLTRGRGGRRVVELGLEADIADAARLNRSDHQIVAELRRDPLRIVACP